MTALPTAALVVDSLQLADISVAMGWPVDLALLADWIGERATVRHRHATVHCPPEADPTTTAKFRAWLERNGFVIAPAAAPIEEANTRQRPTELVRHIATTITTCAVLRCAGKIEEAWIFGADVALWPVIATAKAMGTRVAVLATRRHSPGGAACCSPFLLHKASRVVFLEDIETEVRRQHHATQPWMRPTERTGETAHAF